VSIHDISKLIAKLRELRDLHGFRAETLVPDLALVGLVDDTVDAAEEALQLSRGPRAYRAYAMVRVAFEAAQRLLVLATANDYIRLGTRAWLYYVGKDEALRAGTSSEQATDYQDRIVQTWASRYPEAVAVIEAEGEHVKKIKRPDNFTGRDLAEAVGDAYATLAKAQGRDAPQGVVETTRAAYRVLCRDTHACMRLEPRGFRIDNDGFVDVVAIERDTREIQQAVALGLSSSLKEAITGVQFRISRRQEAHFVAVRAAIAEDARPVTENFQRDFGLFLLERNLANATQTFYGIVLQNLAVLADGTLSSSTTVGVGEELFLATFDFKGAVAQQLVERLREVFPQFVIRTPEGQPTFMDLPAPFEVNLDATIGYFQRTAADRFVPFVVTKVFS
jgi:hypothetical protein